MILSAHNLGNHVILSERFDRPFRSEQDFKKAFMTFIRADPSQVGTTPDVFEIENEEKEPGFPDLLVIYKSGHAEFFEMKLADKSGNFKMEVTQPRFYKSHPDLDISVVVWFNGSVFILDAAEVAEIALSAASVRLNIRSFRKGDVCKDRDFLS